MHGHMRVHTPIYEIRCGLGEFWVSKESILGHLTKLMYPMSHIFTLLLPPNIHEIYLQELQEAQAYNSCITSLMLLYLALLEEFGLVCLLHCINQLGLWAGISLSWLSPWVKLVVILSF